MEGTFTVVCMLCFRPMVWSADDEDYHCPIHNPIPPPTLYDWDQEEP